jgi:hypothetical protein
MRKPVITPGPAQNRQVPRRPILDLAHWVVLPRSRTVRGARRSRETRNPEVVTQQGGGRRACCPWLRVLALVVVARAPVEHRANAQRFASMPHHVLGADPGGAFVVAAAGGDVWSPNTSPARWADPAFRALNARAEVGESDAAGLGRYSATTAGHAELPAGKRICSPSERYTWSWKKNRGEALGARRVDSADAVPDDEGGHRAAPAHP